MRKMSSFMGKKFPEAQVMSKLAVFTYEYSLTSARILLVGFNCSCCAGYWAISSFIQKQLVALLNFNGHDTLAGIQWWHIPDDNFKMASSMKRQVTVTLKFLASSGSSNKCHWTWQLGVVVQDRSKMLKTCSMWKKKDNFPNNIHFTGNSDYKIPNFDNSTLVLDIVLCSFF